MGVDLVKITFDRETENNLFEYCLKHRLGIAGVQNVDAIKPADFNFHITIMHSVIQSSEFKEGVCDFGPHICNMDDFDYFGPENELLVLKIEHDGVLNDLHEYYKRLHSHIPSYNPFRPHITIKGAGRETQSRLKEIPRPQFQLKATHLIHKLK